MQQNPGKVISGNERGKDENKHYSQSGYSFWSQFKERVQLKGLDWGKKAEREHFGLKKKTLFRSSGSIRKNGW